MSIELSILCTTALKTTFEALTPEFGPTGYRVSAFYGPSSQLMKKLADGEPADAAILTQPHLAEMTRGSVITADDQRNIAKSKLAVAVLSGAPRPDISTSEKFKRAMLEARSVAMSNPQGGGQSGVIVMRAFEKLGIVDAMKAKTVYGAGGPDGMIGNFLIRREAEIGIQQSTELMAVAGIDIIGPLPDDLQEETVFALGAVASATHPEAARIIGQVLRSPAAMRTLKTNGLEPA